MDAAFDEIYGERRDLDRELRAAVLATGWVEGQGETPHRLTLCSVTRREVAAFEIDQEPSEIVERMRDKLGHVGYRRYDWLEEWRDGVESISLRGTNGEFRGRSWLDLLDDPSPVLPAEVLAPLRAHDPAAFAATLLEHLYGPPADPGPAQVFHAPYRRVDDAVLAAFFDACRAVATSAGELTIPGIARLVWRRFRDGAGGVITAVPEPELKAWADGQPLALDLRELAPHLPELDLHDVAARLRRAFATDPTGPDLLFGPRLALHVREYPAYEGRNPRTGEPVRIVATRLPFFVFGDPYAALR